MILPYRFTFEPDWRRAPLAFWVHVPVAGMADAYLPRTPTPVPHKGFVFLHVEAGGVDLQFSSRAQLDHFIAVMAARPLPTSRQLSSKRDIDAGPNGHWLSRLPARLKAPRERARLVDGLEAVRKQLDPLGEAWHCDPRLFLTDAGRSG